MTPGTVQGLKKVLNIVYISSVYKKNIPWLYTLLETPVCIRSYKFQIGLGLSQVFWQNSVCV